MGQIPSPERSRVCSAPLGKGYVLRCAREKYGGGAPEGGSRKARRFCHMRISRSSIGRKGRERTGFIMCDCPGASARAGIFLKIQQGLGRITPSAPPATR